jgi:hypothetical protein
MCAAKIEILTKDAVVKYIDQPIGEGPGVYRLSNPVKPYLFDDDPERDGISGVSIAFGEKGQLRVRTREHDTTISGIALDIDLISLGQAFIATSEQIIFGESYGHGKPDPVEIVDSRGEVLAVVSHQKSRKIHARK